jgi:hypothetical protein
MPWLNWRALTSSLASEMPEVKKPRIGLIHPDNAPDVLELITALVQACNADAVFIHFGEPAPALNIPQLVKINSPHASFITHEHLRAAKLDIALFPRSGQFWSGLAGNHLLLSGIAAGCACISTPLADFEQSPVLTMELDAHAWTNAVTRLLTSAEARHRYASELQDWASQQFDTQRAQNSASAAYLP